MTKTSEEYLKSIADSAGWIVIWCFVIAISTCTGRTTVNCEHEVQKEIKSSKALDTKVKVE